MRLVGMKFTNGSGHPVKVIRLEKSTAGYNFVCYADIKQVYGNANYIMKLPEHTFLKKYKPLTKKEI